MTFGYQKVGLTGETAESGDLDDAHYTIELLAAILRVSDRERPVSDLRDLHATLAQMQLGYVQALGSQGRQPEGVQAVEETIPRRPSPNRRRRRTRSRRKRWRPTSRPTRRRSAKRRDPRRPRARAIADEVAAHLAANEAAERAVAEPAAKASGGEKPAAKKTGAPQTARKKPAPKADGQG